MPAFHPRVPSGEPRACWIEAAGRAGLRPVTLAAPGPHEVRVRALHSGISRGTEALVFRGEVPESEYERMRAPFQEGSFPAPLKYGYASVGVVEQGAPELLGRTVFCLHPHQSHYVVPAAAVHVLPDSLPPARAVLAANMETAVNALWDAAPRLGDRIAVVGAGVVGLLVGWLAGRLPGCSVQMVDTNPGRRAVARQLGLGFATPDAAAPDADAVVHASGSGEGLATALRLAAFEATVLELSWYGQRAVTLPLGEAFHARRLTLRSSQVGQVATAQRARWNRGRRMALALGLLCDPVLDVLVTDAADFEELPAVLARLAAGGASHTLCHRIDYP
ncbi:zinc-binding alcohol dehydrogenase [Variovorax defluvii]|uniref:Zinc-binding alcohol dehydrogenase n=1 Tax=Variovorax defluvii TaxID=913761 RepID=A0ABP8HYW7_9BURK